MSHDESFCLILATFCFRPRAAARPAIPFDSAALGIRHLCHWSTVPTLHRSRFYCRTAKLSIRSLGLSIGAFSLDSTRSFGFYKNMDSVLHK